jgi:hypothetical protein
MPYPATPEHFYKRGDGALNKMCKTCYRAKRKGRKSLPKTAIHKGEILAIDMLCRNGIFATSGKSTSNGKWIDVMAWGCVKIEVKYSAENTDGCWGFGFTSTRNKNTQHPHLIMLIGERYTGERRYYLFPENHPVFFNEFGERKKGIGYKIDAIRRSDNLPQVTLTEDLLKSHRNAWHLIEMQRQRVIMELTDLHTEPVAEGKAA